MSVVPVHARDAAARYEFVQIRILHEVDAAPTLETLGMDAQTLGILHESLAAPYGLTLFAGIPSRMAKSVLAAALRAVMKPALSAVMLEKTPEFFVEGARQIKLNPKLSFADGLQVLDELDPDIVVLDEIRDAQAVAIALTLASGGKKVMATLSAPDAPGALSAVLAHTPDPYRLAYGLHAIVAVSTLRKLCPRCKHQAPPAAAIPGVQAISAADLQNIPRYKAVGCIDCLGGYRGVVPVFEAFPATSELRDLLLSHPSLPLDAAIADSLQRTGYRPMLQSALDLLTQGITTVEEVGRIAR
jgi:type II secretory ATPase GspE/PulE/Tfp pilus assembly ATPase PilB-like protein